MPYKRLFKWMMKIFKLRKNVRLGIYGPPNSGKTTLANQVIKDFIGEGEWEVSHIPHETRKVHHMKEITLKTETDKELVIDLFDMPGIQAHEELHTDAFEDFLDSGLSHDEAGRRLIEATEGIAEAITYMKDIDSALVVVDSSVNPFNKVNALLLGVLKANDVDVVIVANKIDLEDSNPDDIKLAFPGYPVVEVSLTEGKNIVGLYEMIAAHLG